MKSRIPSSPIPLLLALALSACGGGTPELQLSTAETLNVVPGSEASITLTLTRNTQASGEVTFSIHGLPSGVTGTFEPAVVGGEDTTATLRLQAARDAARGVALATVRASGPKELVVERPLALEVRGLRIEGELRSAENGKVPVPTAIRIGDQWLASDRHGRFSADDIPVPYDLYVLSEYGAAEGYLGLTTPTPNLTSLFAQASNDWADDAYIQLEFTPALEPNERVYYCVAGESVDRDCSSTSSNSTGRWVDFTGPGPYRARIVAHRVTVDADGNTTGINGFGEVEYQPGESTEVTLQLEDATAATASLSLNVEDPRPWTVDTYVSFGPTHSVLGSSPDLAAGEAATLLFPQNGPAYFLAGQPDEATERGYAFGPVQASDSLSVSLPEPPSIVSPAADVAAATPETVFEVEAREGVYTHIFLFSGPSSVGMLFLHTEQPRVTLPSLEELFPRVAPDNLAMWVAVNSPATPDINTAASGAFGLTDLMRIQSGFGGPDQITTLAFGETRAFGVVGPISLEQSLAPFLK